jgi:diguanylate cyclase (GGDEF)-like protein
MALDDHYFAEQVGQKKYMMFLDLDHFKEINDKHGHRIGDYLLQEMGSRLHKLLNHWGIVCRYGGDEFIILINASGSDEAMDIAKTVVQSIREPVEIDGKSFVISASIGITECNAEVKDIETLIKSSDEAMYEAKKSGQAYCLVKVG